MFENLTDLIGNTPLVRIQLDTPAQCYAKLEYLNPGGSIKDRPALYMIEQAEKRGDLKPGGTIIEASTGNQASALAMIGSLKGYRVIITMSEKISREKVKTVEAHGAEVLIYPQTNSLDDPQSYRSHAIRIHRQTPNSFMPNQYHNPDNRDAHQLTTGPEIWHQTNGKITHFFAGAGTGGTISGVGRYLKQKNPAITVVAFDSTNSYRATGGRPKPYKIEGMGLDFEPPLMDHNAVDEILTVSDDQMVAMLKLLARKHGILAGLSAAAVAAGVQQYAPNFDEHSCVVMIFGDSGRAYLSKNFY